MKIKDSAEHSGFAVGIPTHNRPNQLKSTLASISRLDPAPNGIFVCDSSPLEIYEKVIQICNEAEIPTTLIRSNRPSIPFQRNCLISVMLDVQPSFEYVLFLDDDTEPDPSYSEKLIEFLKQNPLYGGAAGITQTKARSRFIDFLGYIFLVNGKPGNVLLSGVGIPPNRFDLGGTDVEWIFGCSMWRREVLEKFRWNDSWDGYAAGEDVYFSFCVSRCWKLRVIPSARIVNSYAEAGRPTSFQLARMTVSHRWEIAQLHARSRLLLRACVTWSVVGEIGFVICLLIVKPARHRILSLVGFGLGLSDIFRRPSPSQ